jgi:hypothetical protein
VGRGSREHWGLLGGYPEVLGHTLRSLFSLLSGRGARRFSRCL